MNQAVDVQQAFEILDKYWEDQWLISELEKDRATMININD